MLKTKTVLSLFASAFVALTILVLPETAQANMSSTPWIHSIIQDGGDVEITVSIFEEVTTSSQGEEPFPGLEAPYTLEWLSTEGMGVVFENRVFQAENADEVIEFGCQNWDPESDPTDESLCEDSPDYCVDCDGDDVPECYGICAVAYRYQVMDHCPGFAPDFWYQISTSSDYSIFGEEGELGSSNWIEVLEEAGDQCDSGCSISSVGNSGQTTSLFQTLLKLVRSN